eukprot:m.240488 g.240488  ORF g.240488 m.240488 type:complete len:83 (+) comp15270_c0_seq1:99-347(+)
MGAGGMFVSIKKLDVIYVYSHILLMIEDGNTTDKESKQINHCSIIKRENRTQCITMHHTLAFKHVRTGDVVLFFSFLLFSTG